jgi:hypothetical protein
MLEEIEVVFYELGELLWELGDFLEEPKELSPLQICLVDRHAHCPLMSLERFSNQLKPQSPPPYTPFVPQSIALGFGKIVSMISTNSFP